MRNKKYRKNFYKQKHHKKTSSNHQQKQIVEKSLSTQTDQENLEQQQEIKLETIDTEAKVQIESTLDEINKFLDTIKDENLNSLLVKHKIKLEDISLENKNLATNLELIDNENQKILNRIELLKNQIRNNLANSGIDLDNLKNIFADENEWDLVAESLNKTKASKSTNVTKEEEVAIAEVKNLTNKVLANNHEIILDKEAFLQNLFGDLFLSTNQKREIINRQIDSYKKAYEDEFEKIIKDKNNKVIDEYSAEFVLLANNNKKVVYDSFSDLVKQLVDYVLLNPLLAIAKQSETEFDRIISNQKEVVYDENYLNLIYSEFKKEQADLTTNELLFDSYNSYAILNQIDKAGLDKFEKNLLESVQEALLEKVKFKSTNFQRTSLDLKKYLLLAIENLLHKLNIQIDKLLRREYQGTKGYKKEASLKFFKQKAKELGELLVEKTNNHANFYIQKSQHFDQIIRNKTVKANRGVDFFQVVSILKSEIKTIKKSLENEIEFIDQKAKQLLGYEVKDLNDTKKDIELALYDIYNKWSELIFELNEYLLVVDDYKKHYYKQLSFKINEGLSLIKAFKKQYAEENDFNFGNEKSYLNIKVDHLKRQFNKLANLLTPLTSRLNDVQGVNLENLKLLEDKLETKINNLVDRFDEYYSIKNVQDKDLIEQIISINQDQKQSILNTVKDIEEEKIRLLEKHAILSVEDKNKKIEELDELITKQNAEIAGLLNDKEELMSLVEKTSSSSKPDIDQFNKMRSWLIDIKQEFENRIDNLEYGVTKQISRLTTNSSANTSSTTEIDQSGLLKEIDQKISDHIVNNYEALKQDFKVEFVDIFNFLNRLNDKVNQIKASKESYSESTIYELSQEFDRFRNLLTNLTELIRNSFHENADNLGLIVKKIEKEANNLLSSIKYENQENITQIANIIEDKFDESYKFVEDRFFDLYNVINNNFVILAQNTAELVNNVLSNHQNLKDDLFKLINSIRHSEANEARSLQNAEKLKRLEDIIDLQNHEINSLFEEKTQIMQEVLFSIKSLKGLDFNGERNTQIIEGLENVLESYQNSINFSELNVNKKVELIKKEVETINRSNYKDEIKLYFNVIEDSFVNNFNLLKQDLKQIFFSLKEEINALEKYSIDKTSFNASLDKLINEVSYLKTNDEKILDQLKAVNINVEKTLSFETKIDRFVDKTSKYYQANKKANLKLFEENFVMFKTFSSQLSGFIQSQLDKLSSSFNNDIAQINPDFSEVAIQSDLILELKETFVAKAKNLLFLIDQFNLNVSNFKNFLDAQSENNKQKIVHISEKVNNLLLTIKLTTEQINQNLANFENLEIAHIKQKDLWIIAQTNQIITQKITVFTDNVSDFTPSEELLTSSWLQETVSNKLDQITSLFKNQFNFFETNEDTKAQIDLLYDRVETLKTQIHTSLNEQTIISDLDKYQFDLFTINLGLLTIKDHLLVEINSTNYFDPWHQFVKSKRLDILQLMINKILVSLNAFKEQKLALLKNDDAARNHQYQMYLTQFESNFLKRVNHLFHSKYAALNRQINELVKMENKNWNKLNVVSLQTIKQADPNQIALVEKIEKIESEINSLVNTFTSSEIEIDSVKNEVIEVAKDSEEKEEIKKAFDKFANVKKEIEQNYLEEIKSFKQQFYQFKQFEFEQCINELEHTKALLVSSNEYKLVLDDLEELNFLVTSLNAEKDSLFNEYKTKLNFLNQINLNPQSELEANIHANKYKKDLLKQALNQFNQTFETFKNQFNTTLAKIKKVSGVLNESSDINKNVQLEQNLLKSSHQDEVEYSLDFINHIAQKENEKLNEIKDFYKKLDYLSKKNSN